MFKFRFGPGAQPASAPPSSIDAIRRRARHRLIGASVLVLLGIIGLPWLFDTQPRPIPVDIDIDIPAKDAVPPLILPAPVAPGGQPATVVSPDSTSATPTPAASVVPADAPTASAAPNVPAVDADAARAQALLKDRPVQSGAVRVVVQVGAFAEQSRVREVRQRLERAGLITYTQVAQTTDGPRTRVRVGPFDNQAEAQRVADKIKALGLSAALLTLQ